MSGAIALFAAVAMNADQNGTSYLKPEPATHVNSFQYITRTAAIPVVTPVSNVAGLGYIHISNRRPKYFRARWDLGTTTLHIDGSESSLADEWLSLGSQVIAVGTHIWVKSN